MQNTYSYIFRAAWSHQIRPRPKIFVNTFSTKIFLDTDDVLHSNRYCINTLRPKNCQFMSQPAPQPYYLGLDSY